MRYFMDKKYQMFIEKVKAKTGIDLSLYKEGQMKRRILSFMTQRGFSDLLDFFYAMDQDQKLFESFLDRITINVTSFYRNQYRWEVLEKKIFPLLLEKTKNLKIWSAACSSGEEPFTIAMVLSKYLPLSQIRILATDIDENSIKKAKLGVYNERALEEVPPNVKLQYFTQSNGLFKLDEEIKKTVTFKKHNLLSDSYPSQLDLIVCRNVLIYFTDEAKNEIYKNFNKALKIGGILFVGSTEQIFFPETYGFEVADTFFYRKIKDL